VDSGSSEIPLSGGTLRTVVRVGDTVRRTAGPWTPAVHDLLRHVRAAGFDLAPEPMGCDESGREVLRYLPGETLGWSIPWPEWVRTDEMLDAVGAATAAYHRAAAGFRPPGLAAGLIVCHNDLAPYNMVFRAGRLTGIIDWDLAGPGPPVWDLAFVAWQWVPLHGPFVSAALGWSEPVDRAGRLRRLLDAYGLAERAGFVGTVAERIRYNRDLMLERAASGDAAYQALVDQGHVAGMEEALRYVESAAGLQAAL
jgi:aminoglycoside phosphotransferase (APT) family kinase protein